MAPEFVPLQPLERGYRAVLRVRSAIGWFVWAGLAAGADLFAQDRLGTPPGVVVGPFVALGLWSVLVVAPARWRRWGYAFTDRELHVAHGWLTRVHTIVPVARVQHIDVSQGPIERAAGVATLILHTAGTANSLVVLPGLTPPRAEEIRDAVRARIGDTAW
jgi:membrane protein YdbS with pleckstrin-like domain